MEKPYASIQVFEADMQPNNQNPMRYKLCRNTISFLSKDADSIKDIINQSISDIIQFLQIYKFTPHTYIQIQANPYNCVLIVKNSNIIDFSEFDKKFNIVCLIVNHTIIRNNLYQTTIKNQIIFRQYKTFHQTDDMIQNNMYDNIIRYCDGYDELVCLGGEMYVFASILQYNKLSCYSDFQSIVSDTAINIKSSDNIWLIDYQTIQLSIISDNCCLIANTGKGGMRENLCNQIINNNISRLVIISCNQKSFNRDEQIIGLAYKLIQKINFGYVDMYVFDHI
jgi:hypothetical protein